MNRWGMYVVLGLLLAVVIFAIAWFWPQNWT